MSQYLRRSWSSELDLSNATVRGIAQTPDGYIWIGTSKGLLRFNGQSFRPVQPLLTIPPIVSVLSLTVDGTGGLWIWLGKRMVLYRNGAFEDIQSRLPGGEAAITAIGRATDGSILLATLNHGIVRFSHEAFESVAPPSHGVVSALAESNNGRIWVGTSESGLYFIDSQHDYRHVKGLADAKVNCLLPTNGGELWIGTDDGLAHWNGVSITSSDLPAAVKHTQILTLLKDSDSNLWIGSDHGFFRFNSGGIAKLPVGGDENGSPVTGLVEDAERNLWLINVREVEWLSDGIFLTYSTTQGLPSDHNGSIYVDTQNRLWVAPLIGGIYWYLNGRIHRVVNDGLASDIVYSITGGENGIWIGRRNGGLTHLVVSGDTVDSQTFTRKDGVAQNSVYVVNRTRDGTLWVATLTGGVSHLVNGRFVTFTTSDGLASNSVSNIAESVDGTIWFSTADGLSSLTHHGWRNYHVKDGLPSNDIVCLAPDSTGALWIGTTEGLAYFSAGKISSFAGVSALLQDPIFGIALDHSEDLWLTTASHVLKVSAKALLTGNLGITDLWSFGIEDGLLSLEGVRRPQSVVSDASGRIWLSLRRGISVLTKASSVGTYAPAISHLEDVLVDGSRLEPVDQLRISSGHHRLAFVFVGLNFAAPNRVRYRYRLEDFDRDWSEPTATREATYTNLPPGHYVFRIQASNSRGQWTSRQDAGTTLAFSVAPAYYQTNWFRLSCVAAFLAFLWGLYQLRLRQLAREFNMRLDERVSERARIARELHDTLLQSVQGLILKIHAIAKRIPTADPNRQEIEKTLDYADQVLAEGRDRVRNLRASTVGFGELPRAFQQVVEEAAPNRSSTFKTVVEGAVLELQPIIREETYSIGREALINALTHSEAHNIEVEIIYESREFLLRIRDDGRGIDPGVLEKGGRDNHWGLQGMRERAERMGAKLQLWSRPGSGTEVELTIPAVTAYRSPRGKPTDSRPRVSAVG